MLFFLNQTTYTNTNLASTVAHEVGHYFELDHTHQYFDKGKCRKEPISRTRTYPFIQFCPFKYAPFSNLICESTGDFLRDTPADPDLNSNFSCSYILTEQTDPWGDHYETPPAGSLLPDTRNIMSYNGQRNCREVFSRLQIAVMLHSIERGKSKNNRDGWKNVKAEFDEYETDNDPLTARQILFGEIQERNFHQQYTTEDIFGNPVWSQCDVDWVRFQPNCSQTYEIKTSAMPGRTNADTKITFYDADLNQLAQNDDVSLHDKYSKMSVSLSQGQTYFIRVENMSSNITGYYNLSITLPSISGDDMLCSCENYTIPGLDLAANVTWSASPSGRVSLTPDGLSVLVCRILDGTITLTATINSPACGNSTLTKIIQVGLPYITQNAGSGSYNPHPDDLGPGEDPPINQICTGQQISLNVNVERAAGVTWSRTFALPTNNTWSQTGNSLNFYLWGNDQQATFKVSASNICGVVQEFFSFKSIKCGGDPGDPDPCNQFAVSPNPAVSNINIYVPNKPAPCDDPIIISKNAPTVSKRNITQVKLFDNLGNLKKQQSTAKTKQLSMNISGLTPGIYFLEISDGAFKERQKVVIQ